jgi:hypothetical protein
MMSSTTAKPGSTGWAPVNEPVSMKLAKDLNAFHKLLGSHDLQSGTGSDLLCEVPSVCGEETIWSRF